MRLARTGSLAAAAAAAVATALGAALAGAAGVGLEVDGGELPATGIAFVTGVLSLLGVVLAAALLRWNGRPEASFMRIAVVLTTLSPRPAAALGVRCSHDRHVDRAAPRCRGRDGPNPRKDPAGGGDPTEAPERSAA